MNLFDLNNEIQKLKNMVAELLDREFHPIDYSHYIKQPLKNFKKIYKRKNIYYGTERELYDAIKPDMEIRTFKKMCEERPLELWNYETVVVYAAYKELIGYYVACDGKVLTPKSLSLVKGNPYNSEFSTFVNGGKLVFNRATTVYATFVDPDYDTGVFHIDSNYGNCSIDNLEPKL